MFVVPEKDLYEWNTSFTLQSKSDVASLLSVYKKFVDKYGSGYIHKVVEKDGHYGFVMSDSEDSCFDLFQFINTHYILKGVEINCANARLLFPEELSRGEYVKPEIQPDEQGTGVFEEGCEESPTGLLDDEPEEYHYLIHTKSGTELPINFSNGVVIGRSVSKTDYSVDNNMLSRVHARVYSKDGICYIEDLGSRNGSFVNNIRVRPGNPMMLKQDSIVRLANEEFKFF